MERQELDILLKEYETCQSHNNSLGQQAWVSISILITVNLLVLAQVIPNLVLKTVPSHGWANLGLVLLIGAVMILILIIFWRWDNRIDFMVWVNNQRMREIESKLIESKLGIWKNWRIRGLDLKYDKKQEEKWNNLKPRIKKMLDEVSKYFPNPNASKDKQKLEKDKLFETWYKPPTTKGPWKFNNIFWILIALWGTVITLEIIIYVWHAAYHWLL